MLHNSGPNTEPCGTPAVTLLYWFFPSMSMSESTVDLPSLKPYCMSEICDLGFLFMKSFNRTTKSFSNSLAISLIKQIGSFGEELFLVFLLQAGGTIMEISLTLTFSEISPTSIRLPCIRLVSSMVLPSPGEIKTVSFSFSFSIHERTRRSTKKV